MKLTCPQTLKGDVTDTYHGVVVADPYRWLEDDVRKSSAVADWVAAQNKVTQAFLESIPERAGIRARITELWDFERFGAPSKGRSGYIFTKNNGLQNQAVLYIQETLDSEPRLLLDPNAWSKDGTVDQFRAAAGW